MSRPNNMLLSLSHVRHVSLAISESESARGCPFCILPGFIFKVYVQNWHMCRFPTVLGIPNFKKPIETAINGPNNYPSSPQCRAPEDTIRARMCLSQMRRIPAEEWTPNDTKTTYKANILNITKPGFLEVL
jgi:hypothetical protein